MRKKWEEYFLTEKLTYNEYEKMMVKIAYWLIKNNKKVSEKDYYNINNHGVKKTYLKTKILEGKGVKYTAYGTAYMEHCITHDKSYKNYPNYVTFENVKYYKDTYTDMCKRVVAYRKTHKKNPKTVRVQGGNSNNITNKTAKKLLKEFEDYFGKVTDFDSALRKIESRGYAYYYDSQYNNHTTLQRIIKRKGVNCTDSSQLMRAIAIAKGYEVQFIHVMCSSGGHVRLRLKHKKSTNGKWIYRDPACVLSDNDKGITCNWCMDGKILAYDPSWLLADAME